MFMHGDDCVAKHQNYAKQSANTERNRQCHLRARRADLAAMPGGPHLIPSRTQSLSPPGPMVLCLKARESRSLPGLHGARVNPSPRTLNHNDGLGLGRDALGRAQRGRLRIWNAV